MYGEPTALEVSYIVTLDDHVAFSLHWLKRSGSGAPPTWPLVVWALLAVGGLIGGYQLADTNPAVASPLRIAGVWFAILGVAWPILYPPLHWAAIRSAVRRQAEQLGLGRERRITLALTEDTLTEWADSVESVARWDAMKGVEVVGDCTYIYVTSMLTAVVPRHGFKRPETYEAVRDFALAKLDRPEESE